MRSGIFCIIILLSSCSYSVYTECKNTKAALLSWQEVEDFDYYISQREKTANIIIRKWEHNHTPLGAYYGHGVIDANDNYRTISHELGHFFGYIHSENSNSIMYKYNLENATQFIDLRR